MMKWHVLTLFYITSACTELLKNVTLLFLPRIVKFTPVFPVFSVGRNEHKYSVLIIIVYFVIFYRFHPTVK